MAITFGTSLHLQNLSFQMSPKSWESAEFSPAVIDAGIPRSLQQPFRASAEPKNLENGDFP